MNDNFRATIFGLILLFTLAGVVKTTTHSTSVLADETQFNTNMASYLDHELSGTKRLEALDLLLIELSQDLDKWPLLRRHMISTLDNTKNDLYVRYQGLLKLQALPTVGPSFLINLLYDNKDVFTESQDRLLVILEALANSQEKTAFSNILELLDLTNTKPVTNNYALNNILDKIGRYFGSINDPSTVRALFNRYDADSQHQKNIKKVISLFLDHQIRHIEGRDDFRLTAQDIFQVTSMIGSESFLDKDQDKFFVLSILLLSFNGDPNLFKFITDYFVTNSTFTDKEGMSPKRKEFLTQLLEKAEEVKNLYETIRIQKSSSESNGDGTRLLLLFLTMGASEFLKHENESKKHTPEQTLYSWYRNWLCFAEN